MVNYLLSQNLGRTLFRPFPPPPTLLLFLVSIECLPWFWVGWLNEKRQKNLNKSEKRGPETTASLPWSLETTRHGHQINTNSILKAENAMVDVMVKSKKDKPLKLISLEIMNNTMLFIVQIKRIDLSKKRFYYLVPIFWKKGGSYDAKRRKKEDGLIK